MPESKHIIISASEEVGELGVFYVPSKGNPQNLAVSNREPSYTDAWDEVADIIKVQRGEASAIKEELKETYRAFLGHKKTIIQLLEDEMERNEHSLSAK